MKTSSALATDPAKEPTSRTWQWVRAVFHRTSGDEDELHRRLFLVLCLCLGLPLIVVFGLSDLLAGNRMDAIAVWFFGGLVLVALPLLFLLREVRWLYRIVGLALALLLLYFIYKGTKDPSGLLWTYTFPLAAVFVFGKREGTIWLAVFAGSAGLAIAVPTLLGSRIYESWDAVHYLSSLFVVSLLSLALEILRNRYQERLVREREDLRKALEEVNVLSGLLPICSVCKKLRDDRGYWQKLESFLSRHTGARFSHGVCPECAEKLYGISIGQAVRPTKIRAPARIPRNAAGDNRSKKSIDESAGLGELRSRLLNRLLLVILVLGVGAAAAVSVEEILAGRPMLTFFYGSVLAVVLMGILFRRAPYGLRSALFLLALFAVGVSELYLFGIASLAFLFFFAAVTFSAVLLGRTASFLWGLACVAVIAAMAALYSGGLIPITSPVQQVSLKLNIWISPTASFLLLAVCSLLFVTLFLDRLQKSMTSAQQSLKKLENEVAERVKAEESLRRSEEHFRSMIESISDALFVTDPNGRISYCSPSAELLLGRPADQIRDRNVRDLVHSSSRAAIVQLLEDARQGNLPLHPVPCRIADSFASGDRHVEVVGNRIENPHGVPRLILTWQEVTQRLRDIAEKAKLEEQLRQTQKMEAVGRLAGGIAHDFNNVLTVISGYAELIAIQPPDGGSREESAREITRAVGHAASLVRQLLVFSRRQVLQLVPLDLNALVTDLEGILRRTIGERIVLFITLAPGPPHGQGRPDTAPAGHPQPRAQRPGRNAGGRPPEPGDQRLRSGRRREALDFAHRERHGRGDGRTGQEARVRAVLHHQGVGPRHRPRPGNGPRHRLCRAGEPSR